MMVEIKKRVNILFSAEKSPMHLTRTLFQVSFLIGFCLKQREQLILSGMFIFARLQFYIIHLTSRHLRD